MRSLASDGMSGGSKESVLENAGTQLKCHSTTSLPLPFKSSYESWAGCTKEETLKRRRLRMLGGKGIVQRSAEWYAVRKTLITASEASVLLRKTPAIVGSYCQSFDLPVAKVADNKPVSLYKSRKGLFEEKLGLRASRPGSPHTEWGTRYEAMAIRFYERLKGVHVEERGLMRHPEIDWVAASPDGFIPEHVSPGAANVIPERLIEVKCPFQRRLDATIVPLSYWIQMQIQMEVCNIDLCDFFEVRMREYWSEGDFLGDFFTPDWHRGVYLMVDEAKRRNWENAVWSTQEGSLLGPDPEMIPTSHESDPMNHHHAVMDAHGREESRLALESTETTVSSPPATVILPPNDIVRPQDLCNWAHSLLRQPYPPRPSTESRGDSSAVHPTERTFSDFFSPKFYHVEAFDIKTVTRDQPWFAHVRSVLEQSATDLRSRLKSINAGMSVEELGVELSENETDAEDSPANSITDSSGYMTSRSDATSLVFEEPQIVETVGQTESGLGDPDRAFGQDSSSLGVSPDDSATLTFTKRRRRSRKAASSGCEGDVSNDPLLEPVPPEMPLEPTPSSDGRERSKRVAKTPFGKVTKEDTPTPSPDARKRSKHGAKGPSTMKASSAKDEAINSGDTIQNSTGKRRKRSSPEPESPFSSSVEGVSQTLQSGVRENTRGAHSSADTNVKRQRRNKRAKHEVAESLPLDVVTDFEPEDPVVLSIVSKRRKRSAVEVASTRARSKTIIADGHPVGQSTKSKTSLKKKFRIPPLTDTRIGMSEEQAVFHAVRFIEGAKA